MLFIASVQTFLQHDPLPRTKDLVRFFFDILKTKDEKNNMGIHVQQIAPVGDFDGYAWRNLARSLWHQGTVTDQQLRQMIAQSAPQSSLSSRALDAIVRACETRGLWDPKTLSSQSPQTLQYAHSPHWDRISPNEAKLLLNQTIEKIAQTSGALDLQIESMYLFGSGANGKKSDYGDLDVILNCVYTGKEPITQQDYLQRFEAFKEKMALDERLDLGIGWYAAQSARQQLEKNHGVQRTAPQDERPFYLHKLWQNPQSVPQDITPTLLGENNHPPIANGWTATDKHCIDACAQWSTHSSGIPLWNPMHKAAVRLSEKLSNRKDLPLELSAKPPSALKS